MTPKVCLTMIVRNEEAVIERCLDAARPVIDAVNICDTGSTDGTVDRIRRWLNRAGVPGEIHEQPFVDFAHNRTLSLQSAASTIRRLGWDAEHTYLLLLDADMVLLVDRTFRREDLVADVYNVVQQNGSLRYQNVRLVRARLGGRFVGATHEYFETPAGATSGVLESLTIDDRNDGGSRGDKYQRDRRLLEDALARDPADQRAMFYLAQTYHGLGLLPQALALYRRRAESGGWYEEAWYSQYAVGMILVEGRNDRAALRAFVTALRQDPERPESYFHLASLLRGRKHPLWAARFARAGLALGLPKDRSLFVDRDICRWGLLRELSIAGFGTPYHEEALEANERLALSEGTPPALSEIAAQNAVYYAEPLAASSHVQICPTLPPNFSPCNPSIVRTDDGYRVLCRSVSYLINDYQHYISRLPDGALRTHNVLMRLDRQLALVNERDVVSDLTPIRESYIQGFEDCRLVQTTTGLSVTCTTLEHHPIAPWRISLLDLGEDGRLSRHRPLSGYHDDQPQKNWLPFTDLRSGELFAIYGYDPFVVLRVDAASGRCEPAIERVHDRDFGIFRGSAGPIDLPTEAGGGRLIIVHQVAFHHLRYYLHRFLRVDDDWNVTAASRPFFFRQRTIEFACGACLSHDNDLLITFGVNDREAWLCRLTLENLNAMLRPLPQATGVFGD